MIKGIEDARRELADLLSRVKETPDFQSQSKQKQEQIIVAVTIMLVVNWVSSEIVRREENGMSQVNVCCPFLSIVDCQDCEEHNHPCCSLAEMPISNNHVRQFCLQDNEAWHLCVYFALQEESV